MTDVAALALNIDSTSVVTATNDLDAFSSAATRAGAASGNPAGSIAKLVATISSMDSKLTAIVGSLDKISRSMGLMSRATQTAAAANDNIASSATKASQAFDNADAHVNAYRNHLQSLVADQARVSAAFRASDAHVLAYAEHLRSLSAIPSNPVTPGGTLSPSTPGAAPTGDFTQTGKSAQLAAHHVQNLGFQLNDVFVSLASGQNPLTVFVQQGSQIAQIYSQAGLGLRGFAAAIAGLLAPLLPLVAVLALAVAGIAALTSQANDDSGLKKYTTAMGYTKEEVKKLNAVTVTFGDTLKAVFQVGWERIATLFGNTTDGLSDKWTSFTDWLVTATRASIAGVYAAFTGMQNVIPRILDNIKSGKKEGLLEIVGGSFSDQYKEAQAFMDDVVKQAGKNARTRQDAMAKGMYDKPAASAHKYDFSDILKEAGKMENDLTKAAAHIGLYGEALARVTYEQDLFNKASEHGLKLNPRQAAQIKSLAASMAALSEANRTAVFRENTKQAAIQQFAALQDASAQIGVYGQALASLKYEQEMLNKAVAEHITLTENDRDVIKSAADALAAKDYSNTIDKSKADNAKTHAEAMRQLDVERGALGLTGEALISYNYQQEMINKSLQAGVAFKDLDIEKTRKQGDAYAKAASDLAKAQEMDGVKSRGLDSLNNGLADAIMGAKSLGAVFKDVANQIISDLLRIAIRRAITEPLGNALFGGGSGGGAGGGGFGFANGGTFGTAQRFANGGAFTNSVVTSPTLFRFAKGSALGEMGEAGPEAIMPLKRGPNGALGVASHGGGARTAEINLQQDFHITGTVGPSEVATMVQMGAESAVEEVKRNLNSYLADWEANGAVV